MAVTYSLSPPPDVLFGSATTAAGPMYEIRTGPTDYALISRIGLRLINAVGSPVSTIGIGVPAARGSGVQVSYPLISESPQVDGNGLGYTADRADHVSAEIFVPDWSRD